MAFEAEAYFAERSLARIPRQDLMALVQLALARERMDRSFPFHDVLYTEGLTAFGRWFKERPDDVLDLLRFVREQSAIARDSSKGRVQQFLLSHNVVVKKKNQLMLPEKLSKEDFEADGYTLREHLQYVPIANLTDGEIAALALGPRTKKAEPTVKKARQELQKRLDRHISERSQKDKAAAECFARRFLHPQRWQPLKGIK